MAHAICRRKRAAALRSASGALTECLCWRHVQESESPRDDGSSAG
eukprot:CAMPEP_0179185428 /NCGR_PEP_ID=MMETSP0796-20121207/91948_1 /TAXON_ID=73915 /ORGANISM="Pyrodinium bahamense, Strain pbaha01" /LENGTH=44 /DNA_ID= /DNA_START= /DNA_END= /DNA_ORIENTATION=